MPSLLTKSLYLKGLESKAYLWRSVHDPSSLPKPTAEEITRMQQGLEVGRLAQQLFPEGINVFHLKEKVNLQNTKDALKERQPLFEAGFSADRCLVRLDILFPVGKNEWDIYEAKASTGIKDEHLPDIAFQRYVCEKAGLKIRKCHIVLLNGEYVRNGKLDLKQLFTITCIDEQCAECLSQVPKHSKSFLSIIDQKTCPKFELTELETCCDGNPVAEDFYNSLPQANVFELYRGGKKSRQLYSSGCTLMKDIPKTQKLTDNQKIQQWVAIHQKPHIDHKRIDTFLAKMEHPLHHMDFETFSVAIPMFENSSPYQQIPFQFSIHIESSDGKLHHKEYLYDGDSDCRREFIESLLNSLGKEGSVIAYNKSFEIARLKELAELYPDLTPKINQVIERIIDLLEPFQQFAYYDPRQKGSCSIKVVLPLFSQKSHKHLEITNGAEASNTFYEITYKDKTKNEAKIRKALLEYCKLDTLAMHEVLCGLRSVKDF